MASLHCKGWQWSGLEMRIKEMSLEATSPILVLAVGTQLDDDCGMETWRHSKGKRHFM